MGKLKAAIIGSGNIGTDLMYKIERSPSVEMVAMIGIDPDSEGLKRAKDHGYRTFTKGIEEFMEEVHLADIVFDATTAEAHKMNNKLLQEQGKIVVDLTPAAIGPFVVPTANLAEHIQKTNVNMITCGGQATIPVVRAISDVVDVDYAEIIAAVSSKSAGPGTRANIDEFTKTTSEGIEVIGRAKKGKAIIILNPAEPPIMMRNTIHALVTDSSKMDEVLESINQTVAKIQEHVPGYRLRSEPIVEKEQISVFIEVEGAGDFFPNYSGNLDIMTASALKVAEEFSTNRLIKQK